MNFCVGDDFHGLKLLAYCGQGGFGKVFYAEDITKRHLAVKIISKDQLGDYWKRELNGVVNYRKITEDDPSLLQIFHIEDKEEYFYYTMEAADSASDTEYIPLSLTKKLEEGPLSADAVYTTLFEIFSGIKVIHENKLIHRDIKPDNILFVKGKPKLADIGLVSSIDITHTRIAGTLEFIPPEERITEYNADNRSAMRQQHDLYAFGKVVYCAITGMPPQSWPTIPHNLKLKDLQTKLFYRLALSLCEKEPGQRLNTIEKLEKELNLIAYKLEHGERLTDNLKWQLGHMWRAVSFDTPQMFKRYWYIILALVMASGAFVWFIKPDQTPQPDM